MDVIKRADIDSSAGFSSVIQARLRALQSLGGMDGSAILTISPGDFANVGSDDEISISLSLPVAYDVWYLSHTKNILSEDTGVSGLLTVPDLADAVEREGLSNFFNRLGGILPLRTLLNIDDLTAVFSVVDLKYSFQNNGTSMIKEMRFETALYNRSYEFTSPGPAWFRDAGIYDPGLGGDGNYYAGYLAFPVGPLGVMEVLSLAGETYGYNQTVVSAAGFIYEIPDEEKPIEGKEMFPPASLGANQCAGLHIVENGYFTVCDSVEYPANDFTGKDSVSPHNWLRYWIPRDATWPVPGEFIGLLCKPLTTPPHIWWYQDTSPFLCAGNWFETEYYTSGIVLEIRPARAGENEVGDIFKVQVKGDVIFLQATDFYDYQSDFESDQESGIMTRVAILKSIMEVPDNFNWEKLSSISEIPRTVEEQQAIDDALADINEPRSSQAATIGYPEILLRSDIREIYEVESAHLGYTRTMVLQYDGYSEDVELTMVFLYEDPEASIMDKQLVLSSASLSGFNYVWDVTEDFAVRDHGYVYDWDVLVSILEGKFDDHMGAADADDDETVSVDDEWNLDATDPNLYKEWVVVPVVFYK